MLRLESNGGETGGGPGVNIHADAFFVGAQAAIDELVGGLGPQGSIGSEGFVLVTHGEGDGVRQQLVTAAEAVARAITAGGRDRVFGLDAVNGNRAVVVAVAESGPASFDRGQADQAFVAATGLGGARLPHLAHGIGGRAPGFLADAVVASMIDPQPPTQPA